jgi:hypothetical protein
MSQDDVLARLARFTSAPPAHAPLPGSRTADPAVPEGPGVVAAVPEDDDPRLDQLLRRISVLSGDPNLLRENEPLPRRVPAMTTPEFLPHEPESFDEAKVTEGQVEALALKYLLAVATATGRAVAEQMKLPFKLIDSMLARMKNDQLVYYYADAPMNDYVYQLTDMGRERARRFSEISSYFGSAPVDLSDYVRSVTAQSIAHQHPTVEDLQRAFRDLLINAHMLARLGPAVNSGRGLFLYGPPGNGKTSIAERVTAAFGSAVWIPRAIMVDGEIIRTFDPINHEEAPLEPGRGLLQDHVDKRWVRIRRPTIIAGGELTMENLEVSRNKATGTYEAPLQLKSNCGTLVIDDFGRQKMSIDQLLNRWIVPLEKRVDFLNMPSGKKVQVPFDQLIIFSTNLQPKDLVDEAFLRRIPYKVEVIDPTEEEFRNLFKLMADKLELEYREEVVDYVVEHHYKRVSRPFRCCQPRDLLMQVRNYCRFVNLTPEMTKEYLDFAVENYFAVM